KIAHGLFGERVILALHVADAEVELVFWRGAGGQRGQGGAGTGTWTRTRAGGARLRRQCGCRGDRAGAAEIERLAGPASAGSTDVSTAAELAQAILELPVAVLQFLVLPGELAKLVFQPLDPQFRVAIVGLGEGGRGKRERRGERHDPGNHMKSG